MSLLSAVPEPNPRPTKQRIVLHGRSALPRPTRPTGCPFHPRCPLTRQKAAAVASAADTVEITTGGEPVRVLRKCVEEVPPLEQKQGEPGHVAACWVTE